MNLFSPAGTWFLTQRLPLPGQGLLFPCRKSSKSALTGARPLENPRIYMFIYAAA